MADNPLLRHPNRWHIAWTVGKFGVALAIAVVLAVFMLTSSQPTVVPAASVATPTQADIATPMVNTSIATPKPTPVVPQDAFVPGHLIYVKGHQLFSLHNYDDPVFLATGTEPAVSPDGRYVAYILPSKNYQDLYILDLRKHTTTKLLNDSLRNPIDASTGFTAAMPSWSDDGQSVLFAWSYPGAPIPASENFDRTDLSISKCASTGPCNESATTKITTPFFQTGGDYEPVPRLADPSILVYTQYQYQVARDGTNRSLPKLVSLNLTTGTSTVLTPAQDAVSQPVWSPTGRAIAFVKTSVDQRSSDIRVMKFHPPGDPNDYAKARLLVKGSPFAAHPVFSPDGHSMAFVQYGDDGRAHLFIAHVELGLHARVFDVQMVRRAGIIDSDRLTWTR